MEPMNILCVGLGPLGRLITTDFLARSFTWSLPGAATARALGLLAVEHLPGLKPALARQMMFGRR